MEVHDSWVGTSGVISRVTILITHVWGLITPVIVTTHEPPSNPKALVESESPLQCFSPRPGHSWALVFRQNGLPYGSFRRQGVPYFEVLVAGILLLRVLYWGPYFRKPLYRQGVSTRSQGTGTMSIGATGRCRMGTLLVGWSLLKNSG